MNKLSPASIKIYIGLIAALAILAALNIFLPQGTFVPMHDLPASKPVLALANAGIIIIFYGGLGFLGLYLSTLIGFPGLWDKNISNRQRFFVPALVGICVGVFFIIADLIISRYHSLGPIPHPPFPTSIAATAVAGIGEEIMFRLFFISFWVWLISAIFLKNKKQDLVFWIVACFSAVAFAGAHIPSVMFLFNFQSVTDFPAALLIEILILNGVVSIFAAYYFRKYGFLAAVGIHLWTDIIWHVVWGII